MKDRVYQIMSEIFKIPVNKINKEISPDTLHSWDSVNHVILITSLEEEFKVKFDEDQMVEMMDVQSIMVVLEECGVSNVD